jgi:hypothetical protein
MSHSPVHLIISTHTTRHLRRTLLGGAAQLPSPASITVSCDSDDPAIAVIVAATTVPGSTRLTLVQRAHTGLSRSSQVRNNAVRTLCVQGAAPEDLLVFLDGDCVPAGDLCRTHAELCTAGPRRVSLGFRIDLTAEQTAAFDESALGDGRLPVRVTETQSAALRRRETRYVRQALFRRFGIAKAHKPKLLSANFAVSVGDYLAVNGFDEEYEGYGQEDDDFGRRLYRHGCRPMIAIQRAMCYHQYHPTRAPGDWHQSPNAARFAAGGPVRCRHGVAEPIKQPAVNVSMLSSRR